jgi:hypothetical protein
MPEADSASRPYRATAPPYNCAERWVFDIGPEEEHFFAETGSLALRFPQAEAEVTCNTNQLLPSGMIRPPILPFISTRFVILVGI